MHAVHQLFQYRKSLSTTEFKARGQRVKRCELCRVSINYCICSMSPETTSEVGFLMLMYDTEVLKPSNTGRLIADVIPDSFAFLWSRTEENEELLKVLQDDKWQPIVVFPKEYANEEQIVFDGEVNKEEGKRPLFIMLDGSWREAKKMFRKSPYLQGLPVLSFDINNLSSDRTTSRYHLRKAANNNQLATAEVAARVLDIVGENYNAELLDLWFDVFSYQYQQSVCQTNMGNKDAVANYLAFIKENKDD